MTSKIDKADIQTTLKVLNILNENSKYFLEDETLRNVILTLSLRQENEIEKKDPNYKTLELSSEISDVTFGIKINNVKDKKLVNFSVSTFDIFGIPIETFSTTGKTSNDDKTIVIRDSDLYIEIENEEKDLYQLRLKTRKSWLLKSCVISFQFPSPDKIGNEDIYLICYNSETKDIILKSKFSLQNVEKDKKDKKFSIMQLYKTNLSKKWKLTHSNTVELAKDFETSKIVCPPIKAPKTLIVQLIKGKGLAVCDSNGFSDPYCVVYLTGKENVEYQKQKSQIKKMTLDPEWNEYIFFNAPDENGNLVIEVWDHDIGFGAHDFMGLVTIPLTEINIEKNYVMKLKGRDQNWSGKLGSKEKTALQKKQLDTHVIGEIEFKLDLDKITKERVTGSRIFGVNLEHFTSKDKTEKVPHCIMEMIDYINEHGPNTYGVFRVSGEKLDVDELISRIEDGDSINLTKRKDVGTITSCLKQYLRELPDPLLTYEYFDQFLEVNSLKTDEEKIAHLKKTVRSLQMQNQLLILHLFGMLKRIAEKKTENQMTEENLSIVISPNILKPKDNSNEKANKALIVVTQMIKLYPAYIVDDFKVEEVIEEKKEKTE